MFDLLILENLFLIENAFAIINPNIHNDYKEVISFIEITSKNIIHLNLS
jgi:hypothetical protein